MEVSKDVILDLIPLYIAGEASPASRALVEEYLKQDPELAEDIRAQIADHSILASLPNLPQELELKSLHRARLLIAKQQWLFGFALMFTALSATARISLTHWTVHFLIFEQPFVFGTFL